MGQSDDMDKEEKAFLIAVGGVTLIFTALVLAWVNLGPCTEEVSHTGSCSNRQHRMVREPGVTLCRCHDVPAVGSARP